MIASAAASLAATLSVPAAASVTRYLINGNIVVASATLKKVSYLGQVVRVDTYSTDGNTIVESRLRHDFASVPLSGTVASAPAEFAQYFNALYYNPVLLNTAATWRSGAAYLRYAQLEMADNKWRITIP